MNKFPNNQSLFLYIATSAQNFRKFIRFYFYFLIELHYVAKSLSIWISYNPVLHENFWIRALTTCAAHFWTETLCEFAHAYMYLVQYLWCTRISELEQKQSVLSTSEQKQSVLSISEQKQPVLFISQQKESVLSISEHKYSALSIFKQKHFDLSISEQEYFAD